MSLLDICQLPKLLLELLQLLLELSPFLLELLQFLLELRQFLLKLLLVFLAKLPLLKNYIFNPWFYYNIILVSNRLIG